MTVLLPGDCIRVMGGIPEGSVAAIVTDPPYGLGFMGHDWDSPGGLGDHPMRRNHQTNTVNTGVTRQGGRQRTCEDFTKRQLRDARTYQDWCEEWAAECLRVLQPGGFILAFGGTRTYHRLTTGIEEAGFEIRDTMAWLHGQGYPKHKSLLKPALELLAVGRKTGRGWLNIAACKLDPGEGGTRDGEASAERRYAVNGSTDFAATPGPRGGSADGRWPANVLLDEEAATMLDEQTGELASGALQPYEEKHVNVSSWRLGFREKTYTSEANSGGASRFFYVAKPSQAERNAGLTVPTLLAPDAPDKNDHPTVKPIALMRWLVRLATTEGGTVLDPFLGSGTTGIAAAAEGFPFIGIERESHYLRMAAARIAYWSSQPAEAVA